MVPDDAVEKAEHEIVGGTRAAVGQADPLEVVAFQRRVDGSRSGIVLGDVAALCPPFAFPRSDSVRHHAFPVPIPLRGLTEIALGEMINTSAEELSMTAAS